MLRIIKLGIIGVIFINILHYFFILTFSIPFSAENIQNILESMNYDLYGIFAILIFAIWHEILFRGIILPLLLTKYKELISMLISTGIFLLYCLNLCRFKKFKGLIDRMYQKQKLLLLYPGSFYSPAWGDINEANTHMVYVYSFLKRYFEVTAIDLEMEFSKPALELMSRLKKAFDPNGILNPGKILL